MGSVSMLYSDRGQTFGSMSQLFSRYTISLSGRVFGEQRGGAAEILARIGVEHGNQPQLRILGWDQDLSLPIRNYRHRVDALGVFYIIKLIDMIEYGGLCVDVLRLETRGDLTLEWIQKTDAFLDRAFSKVKGASCTWCPCTKCANTRRQIRKDMIELQR